jgi:hypothetical protein
LISTKKFKKIDIGEKFGRKMIQVVEGKMNLENCSIFERILEENKVEIRC